MNQYVILPNSGVFVGIEWIAYLNKTGDKIETKNNIVLSVPLTFSKEKSQTYYRSKFFDNKWFLASNKHPLSRILKVENPPKLVISIIVEEFKQ